jgi:hypothetical protein
MLNLVMNAAKSEGVGLMRLDEDMTHPQVARPVDVVRLPWGGVRRFYPRLFRWRLRDGSLHAILLHPKLIGAKEDWVDMGRRLTEAVIASTNDTR